jgi:hypothetical protein
VRGGQRAVDENDVLQRWDRVGHARQINRRRAEVDIAHVDVLESHETSSA